MKHLFVPILLVILCACGSLRAPVTADPAEVFSSINQILDHWHTAAARADESAYLELLAEDAVFLGTDPGERWTKEEFAEFVEPYFVQGIGWEYIPSEREIRLSDDGTLAWFNENLTSVKYGRLRGSGVLRLQDSGWKLLQYNMTFVLRNDATVEVVRQVRKKEIFMFAPRPLPAGTYFSSQTNPALCLRCKAPTSAVALGVFQTEKEARAAMKALSTVPLHEGYPLVIHTDELAPFDESRSGIVVVLGLFSDSATASIFVSAYDPWLPPLETILLLPRAAAAARYGVRENQTRLVRIQSGSKVEAYSLSDVTNQVVSKTPTEEQRLNSICEVEPGDIFVVSSQSFNLLYYDWAEVRCPTGETALVPWTTTLLDTIIRVDETGRAILYQVTAASIENTDIESWYYDEKGRYRLASDSK